MCTSDFIARAPGLATRARGSQNQIELFGSLGREDRYRTVISGMEPRRIAVVMLLPRTNDEDRRTKLLHADSVVNSGYEPRDSYHDGNTSLITGF
jgi:hypothetical protein